MFQLLRLISVVLLLLMISKVITKPMYVSPQVNQLSNGVQPVYSNLFTSNVNQPYNYVLPSQSYQQQIYDPSAYQTIRSQTNQVVGNQCCLKPYFNSFNKNLLDYYVKLYLQTGEPQYLLQFNQQVTPPLTLKISKIITPCLDKLPYDFVGSSKDSQVEQNREFSEKSSRDPYIFEGKTEIFSDLAKSPYSKQSKKVNDKSYYNEEEKMKLDGKKETMESTDTNSRVTDDNENNDTGIDENEYSKIMTYLQKQMKSKYNKKSSKKTESSAQSVVFDERNSNQMKTQKRNLDNLDLEINTPSTANNLRT